MAALGEATTASNSDESPKWAEDEILAGQKIPSNFWLSSSRVIQRYLCAVVDTFS